MIPQTSNAIRIRRVVMMAVDASAWALALTVVVFLRWEGDTSRTFTFGLLTVIAIAVALQLLVGWSILYRFTWRIGSFEEFTSLSITVVITAGIIVIIDILAFRSYVPASSAVGGSGLAFVLMIGARGGWRLRQELRLSVASDTPRAIIFGAGDAGQQTINTLVSSQDRPFWPVALLDDDPAKSNLQLRHLPVSGTRDDIAHVAQQTGATTVIIAIPTASAALVRDLTDRCQAAGLDTQILPPVAELLSGHVTTADIRPVSEVDLLGRRSIDTEIDAIAHYLTGKRVLVTGAGGSIGSELCRQIHRFEPSALIMLDRDESGLHQVQLSIEGKALLDSRNLVVCDIRDREALDAVFGEHQPEVVFHAAALKHLPLLEMWPGEAYKTNVIGTLNVLSSARAHRVSTFVNISTDKAARPQSVLGWSKRIAERLTSEFARSEMEGSYMSVRFGNVLGSRGSMLTTFRTQVAAGGPITVTDPEVTRYFMTIEEAVQLVIQAGARAGGGDVMILDMGAPVKIDDVARRLARSSPAPIEIVYTGLRPGEKLHEELFGEGEIDRRPDHPLIARSPVPALAVADVVSIPGSVTAEILKTLSESQPATIGTSPHTQEQP